MRINKLYLPGFIVHSYTSPENKDKIYTLIHPRTGQLFFNCDQDGNVAQVFSRQTFWTRPTESYKSIQQIRQDSIDIKKELIKWMKHFYYHLNDDKEHEIEEDNDFDNIERLIDIYGPRKAKEIAIYRIQSCIRRIHATIQMKRQIQALFQKYFDSSTNLYFFINLVSGERQWHRPIGLGFSSEYDIPEITKYSDDYLASLERNTETLENLNPKILDAAVSRHAIDTQHDNFLDGPYCKLMKGKPGKKMIRGLGKHNFDSNDLKMNDNNSIKKSSSDEIMNDIGLNDLNKIIALQDGLRLKNIKIDPCIITRAAYEKGPIHVIRVMEYYHNNKDVIFHGCMALAKFEFKETKEGTASKEAILCLDYCTLDMIDKWKQYPMIIGSLLLVLVNLSNFFPNRVLISTTTKWIDILKDCLLIIETLEANPDFIDTAININKFLFNMACDDKIRENTSKIGFPIITQIMLLYKKEPSVQAAGCSTLFNFVFKNGNTCSLFYNKVKELICVIKNYFPNEYDLIVIANRTMNEFDRLCNGLN